MKNRIYKILAATLLSINAFAQNTYPVKGDVNEDGVVDVADIVAVIDIMANGQEASLKVMVDWSNAKKPEYWYTKNTVDNGSDEIHVSVPSVESNIRDDADFLGIIISDVFLNNQIVSKSIISSETDFNYNNYKYRLVFDTANNGKEFKGASGVTYTLIVSADGRELMVDGLTIAKLVLPEKFADKVGDKEEANYIMIEYQHNRIAHDLLNYCSHNEFNKKNDATLNNFLNIIISLAIQNDDEAKPIMVKNGSFNVRFFRPIDVMDAATEIDIYDISEGGPSIINLNDLLKFKDWSGVWKGVNRFIGDHNNYFDYYGVLGVKVPGLVDGDDLGLNRDVKISFWGETMRPLYGNDYYAQYTYMEDADIGNCIRVLQLLAVLPNFKLEIPVVIEYIWGEINTIVTFSHKHIPSN